jgi:hypothetical protein
MREWHDMPPAACAGDGSTLAERTVKSTDISTLFDVDRARRDTPGCNQVVHFNNAGASLMPRQVLDSVIEHLQLEARIGILFFRVPAR